ncbi:retrovirus-related pol polyprotein from transposon TNT 1-94 [Tanacetum coccineum]
MAAVNDVPQLVDKKGGSYAAIAPKLELEKFNKWKKRMLCYLAGMEPYYLKCIKDGPFQPKTAEGHAKPESQWTPDERRVVVQDQHLKSIIMSCLPHDIMESVVSCVLAKETWNDLVHSFEGPSDTKENRNMDLKLEYQTFRAKSTKSLSQTYTRYKTLLNELANDGVNLSKHEINVGFVNILPEKWLTFSQGLRNANHTQTLDLADIYKRFVYEDNLIQRRYSNTKKALITTLSTLISTAFFSNNVIQDFQENFDDEVDERSSEEYLRDFDIEYHERALLANTKHFIKRRNNFSSQKANENTECYNCVKKDHFARDCFSKTSEPSYKSLVNNYSSVFKGFRPKFTPKLIQSSSNSNNQADTKFQKDYKAEYKKIKTKLALLEASPSSSQNPKSFQPKNKGLVAETFDWDEEEVSDEEEVTQVKVLMALADDELTVGKSHARNGEWVDITIRKVNTLLFMDEDADWQNYLKYISIDLKFVEEQRLNLLSKYNKMVFELNKCRDELLILKQAKLDAVTFQIQNTELTNEQIPHQKKKVLGGELLTESSFKMNENENLFIPASMGYDQEMVPKNKDWVERLNPDSKLPKFNTGRILVPESQAVNESLEPTETLSTPESSKESEAEFITPLPPLKNLQGALPSSKCVSETVTGNETKQTTPSVPTEVKDTEQESKLNELTKLVQMLIDEKILKVKAKPFPPCTYCGFNDHRPGDCRNYHECEICGSYDYFTSGHNRVIQIRGGVLAESSQSNESSIGVQCNTCGSTVHSTSDHNEFDHFKRETHQGAHLVPGQWMLKEYDWCQELSAQICRATRKCLHLLHMDLFGPVSPMSMNNEKYTLVFVDEYSRMVENQNDVKVKEIRTHNGTEFRNHELESFCDEKGIS